jgi:adenosylcobinamide-GDP ribazoletransferase
LSKSVMGILLIKVRAAKEEGLGTLFKRAATQHTLWIYPVYMVLVLGGILLLYPVATSGVLLLMGMAILSLLFAARKAVKWFGGITGDVIGASVEGVELVLWMTLWLWHYFVMV